MVHDDSVSDCAFAGKILDCMLTAERITIMISRIVLTWLCLVIGVHPLSLLLNYISTLSLYFLNGKQPKAKETSCSSKSLMPQKRHCLYGVII